MSTSISQQKQDLQAQIAEATERKVGLDGKLRALDELLGSTSGQRQQYQLLEEICTSLGKLSGPEKQSSGKGAADLFREATGNDPEKQLQQVRGAVAAFQQKISAIEQSRRILQADIQKELASIRLLSDQLAELQKKTEHLKKVPELDRQAHEMPYRATVLPWSRQGEDEQRFRKIFLSILFLTIAFGGLIPFLKPPVEESNGVVVPERIARIIKKKQEARLEKQRPPEKIAENKDEKAGEKPAEKAAEKPVEKVAEKAPEKTPEKVAEKVAEKAPPSDTSKPTEPVVQSPRKAVESKGMLAFKDDMANLLKDSSSSKMGADAHISISAKKTTGDILQRSIIVSQTTGSSGGINAATINRQSEGSESHRITDTEIKFTHVESAASAGPSGADRPLSKGGRPSRPDDEIQLVFDQYKSALYRIYNRELRINPTLRGKMVLRIVIEPDGHVSSCTVKSNDLASPALSADIVDRVLRFNFGPKEGVPAITILYPIDFLPAN